MRPLWLLQKDPYLPAPVQKDVLVDVAKDLRRRRVNEHVSTWECLAGRGSQTQSRGLSWQLSVVSFATNGVAGS